jgi:hypothetical protein
MLESATAPLEGLLQVRGGGGAAVPVPAVCLQTAA